MAEKDVPGTKSHENGGPFRPGFSSKGHPSAPPVCATRLGDVRLGLPSRGHPSGAPPSQAPARQNGRPQGKPKRETVKRERSPTTGLK